MSFPSETNKNSQVHDTTKDCLEEINESVLSCMVDNSNESAQSRPNSDSVVHAELINVSCETQEEDGHENDLCLMFEESYESEQVISESLSVDLSEIQFRAYDDECTSDVDAGNLSRMVINSNGEERMLFDCVSRDELVEMQSTVNEVQQVVVLPDYVADVIVANDMNAQLNVCANIESPVEVCTRANV